MTKYTLMSLSARVVPIDIRPNGGPTESWPPWLLTWQAPIVLRDRDSYSYIVLPQPDSSSSESKATIRTKADEQAYKDALKRIPVSNEKPDPWKSVR
jgi:hypothetical protein